MNKECLSSTVIAGFLCQSLVDVLGTLLHSVLHYSHTIHKGYNAFSHTVIVTLTLYKAYFTWIVAKQSVLYFKWI